MRRALLLCAAVLTLLLGAAAVLLVRGTGIGFATPWVERLASNALGRELRMGEPAHLQIDSGLRLTFRNVTLANAEWATEKPLAALQHAEAVLEIRSLFADTVLIKTLQIDGLDLQLLVNTNGVSNLPVLPDSEDGVREADPGPKKALPLVIYDSHIRNVRVERENRQTAMQALMLINAMTLETSDENTLSVQAGGSLQDRPWQLLLSGTGVESLLSGKNLEGKFKGNLGELILSGDYRIPEINELQNLSLNSTLTGSIPARIAELSPLLEADEPVELRLTVSDTDPGLDIELFADIENLDAHITGSVAEPVNANGLDLSVNLRSKSLPRLSATLGLGETPDIALTFEAKVLRDGQRFEVSGLSLQAGQHQLTGSAVLPDFPDTDNARLDLQASGPDFSFYQRMLKRPVSFEAPYSIRTTLGRGEGVAEVLEGEANIGEHRISFSGKLDNYPSYRDSALRFDANSPDIHAIGEAIDLDLPDAPASISGTLSVSQAGIFEVQDLHAGLLGVSTTLSGQLGRYPDFDALDLTVSGRLASLAEASKRLGMKSLGDLPLDFDASFKGAPSELIISNVSLRAEGLTLKSSDGAIRWTPSEIFTDLELAIELERLPVLLGSYAFKGTPSSPFSAVLLPKIRDDRFAVSLENLSGPGLTGSASAEFARDLSLDKDTRLSAELRLGRPSQLLADIPQFTATDKPLQLKLLARPDGQALELNAQLHDESHELLSMRANTLLHGTEQPIRIVVTGAGDDLRVLGTHAAFPDQALPYAIDSEVTIEGKSAEFTIRKLELAASLLRGTAQWDSERRSVTADLEIPRAELRRWVAGDNAEAPKRGATTETKKDRVIPDITLPLNLLDSYELDLRLSSGPLGLSDPGYAEQSLIDKSRLRLTSRDGQATLQVTEATGSLGRLQGELTLLRNGNKADVHTALTLDDYPLALFAGGTDFSRLPRQRLETELNARGSTLRELAASLDGELLIRGGGGTLGQVKFGFANESFVTLLLQTLLPMMKTNNPNVQVECTVLAVRASEGVLSLDPGFVFRSKRVDLTARGEIDLRSERIRIRFDNQARSGFGISASSLINDYLEITGTLAKPSIGIDMKNSALSGGAAVATGGLTVLAKPLFGRVLALTNPCETALKRWHDAAN